MDDMIRITRPIFTLKFSTKTQITLSVGKENLAFIHTSQFHYSIWYFSHASVKYIFVKRKIQLNSCE